MNNLRWNYEEFRVNYSIDQQKIKVWKYYLQRLLNEQGDKPKHEIDIKK